MTSISTTNMDTLVDRVMRVSGTFDPSNRLPLVIVDSTALPPPKSHIYKQLVEAIVKKLPKYEYSLLFFACGAPNKPSWTTVSHTYSLMDRSIKKRVKKIYILHENWWVRAVTEMLRGAVSSKFRRKLVHVSKLSDLAKLLDITAINIPTTVYLHNMKLELHIPVPRHYLPEFGVAILTDQKGEMVVPKVWSDTMQYLKATAPVVRGIFDRLDETEKALVPILKDAYDRGQLLDIDEYGPNVVAALFKLYAMELPDAILPLASIDLPVSDSKEYTMAVLRKLPYQSKVLMFGLLDILSAIVINRSRTYHSSGSLAMCLVPCLLGSHSSKSKENVRIAVRVLRNMIDSWPEITNEVDERLRSASVRAFTSSLIPLAVTKHRVPNNAYASTSNNQENPSFRSMSLQDLKPTDVIASLDSKRSSSDTIFSSVLQSNMAPQSPPSTSVGIIQGSPVSRTSNGVRTQSVIRKSRPKSSSSVKNVLQTSAKSNIIVPAPSTSMKPGNAAVQATQPVTPGLVRRGRVVAELAAFYENTGKSTQTISDYERDRKKWNYAKGLEDFKIHTD